MAIIAANTGVISVEEGKNAGVPNALCHTHARAAGLGDGRAKEGPSMPLLSRVGNCAVCAGAG